MQLPCRVIKVGGSLFDLPDLRQRVVEFLKGQSPCSNVLIAGGGPFCEYVRQQQLETSASHWLSIRAMHFTASLIAHRLGCREIEQFDELCDHLSKQQNSSHCVFNVCPFLRYQEPALPGHRLAVSDQVTSDSIAARLAEVLGAQELVLLKSCPIPDASLEQLAKLGVVDADFPQAAAPCSSVRLINLRERIEPEPPLD